MLYAADEVFLTGTASEVDAGAQHRQAHRSARDVAVRSREQIQRRFLDVVHGRVADRHGWLTYVRDVVAEVRQPRRWPRQIVRSPLSSRA